MNWVHLYKYTFFYDWSCKLELFSYLCSPTETVRLVQLVEHQIVVLGVVGSSPTSHPKRSAPDGRTFRLRCGAPRRGRLGPRTQDDHPYQAPAPFIPLHPQGDGGKGSPARLRRPPSVGASRLQCSRSERFPGFPYAPKTTAFSKRTISQVSVRFKDDIALGGTVVFVIIGIIGRFVRILLLKYEKNNQNLCSPSHLPGFCCL